MFSVPAENRLAVCNHRGQGHDHQKRPKRGYQRRHGHGDHEVNQWRHRHRNDHHAGQGERRWPDCPELRPLDRALDKAINDGGKKYRHQDDKPDEEDEEASGENQDNEEEDEDEEDDVGGTEGEVYGGRIGRRDEEFVKRVRERSPEIVVEDSSAEDNGTLNYSDRRSEPAEEYLRKFMNFRTDDRCKIRLYQGMESGMRGKVSPLKSILETCGTP